MSPREQLSIDLKALLKMAEELNHTLDAWGIAMEQRLQSKIKIKKVS
jgi:hypothetical protein